MDSSILPTVRQQPELTCVPRYAIGYFTGTHGVKESNFNRDYLLESMSKR